MHCIADGHGPGGHWVSDRVVRILPYFLSSRDCRRLLCRGEVATALKYAFERMQAVDFWEHLGTKGVRVTVV